MPSVPDVQAGVDPDSASAGELAERPEKGRVGAASDFHDVPAHEPVSLDPFPRERVRERPAPGRARLRLDTARGVLDERSVVVGVEDEPTSLADRQAQRAARDRQ